MQTFLFYDIETTGLNHSFDQILQFAAIRTDLKLNEMKRYELNVKLNKDLVPSPSAMMTHHLRLHDISKGISEYEAVKQIHQWFNEPGTISLGYNSLGFDDEFLRFSFYRNLLPPYTHQFSNQCGRMDLYPMAIMYFLFKNHAVRWPYVDGISSFKLEQLNIVNQLAPGRAHHAMVDVEATLALARYFYKEYDMWAYLTGFFNKQVDDARLTPLKNSPALLIQGKLGAHDYYQCPALCLGWHKHYKNQLLMLRLDCENLSDTTPDAITDTTWVINKKLGEPSFILPMKDRFLRNLTPERRAITEKNHQWLTTNPAIFSGITAHYSEFKYPVYPLTDVEARLYLNGFWTSAEENICRAFHAGTIKEKIKLQEKITHPVLTQLALRLLARHYPDDVTSLQSDQYKEYLESQSEVIDYKGRKRLTAEMALEQIAALRLERPLDTEQLEILGELEEYLR